MNFGDGASWAAALIAVGSMIVSIRYAREAAGHQAEITRLTKEQHRLELRAWTDQYFNVVRAWADRVCGTISDAIHMYRLDHSDPLLRRDILARLSALLDSGRWYFPNRHAEQIGSHKPAAYRGLRQPVLDAIFAAYDCIRDERPECGDKLESIQRQFVSYIQGVLDPGAREHEINRVLSEFSTAAEMRAAAP
ncbi:hypothetical protein [Allosphingosinicella sp.]|uniref:hypothetical protein n=1 Tax=Allosphingosinicella sp. TaxID=2823234 RepID=UPI002FC0B284